MLTKTTSEKVLAIVEQSIRAECAHRGVTPALDHACWPRHVVSVGRDACRRGWDCYVLDAEGRLGREFVADEWGRGDEHPTLATMAEAVRESDEGGIDPAALLSHDGPTEGAELAESYRRETTTTCAADVMYSTFRILSPEQVALARDYSFVYFPKRAGKTAAMRQFTAMRAMASVMGQVHAVLYLMGREDYQFEVRGHDRAHSVNLDAMVKGGMARAASRWSAQVRAKVKAHDEARRADVAVRCQGEED